MSPPIRKVLLAAGLAVAAWLAIFGDKTPVGEAVQALPVTPRAVPAMAADEPVGTERNAGADLQAQGDAAPGQIRRLASRRGWYEQASSGRDLFAAPQQAAATEVEAPPAPQAVPFQLIGRLEENGRWTYFLEREAHVYPLRAGETADGFRLVAATPAAIKLERLADQASFSIELTPTRP